MVCSLISYFHGLLVDFCAAKCEESSQLTRLKPALRVISIIFVGASRWPRLSRMAK